MSTSAQHKRTNPAEGARTGVPPPAKTPHELHEAIARMRRRRPIRFDEALVALELVTPEQLARAREAKDCNPSELLGDILQRLSGVDAEAVHAGLAYQLGVPAIDVRNWPADPLSTARSVASQNSRREGSNG